MFLNVKGKIKGMFILLIKKKSQTVSKIIFLEY